FVVTVRPYCAPHNEYTASAHGEPLGEEEIRATKARYGCDPDKHFYVPDAVKARMTAMRERGAQQEAEWNTRFAAYQRAYPELAQELELMQEGGLPEGWDRDIQKYPADHRGAAGRDSSDQVQNDIPHPEHWLSVTSSHIASF